MVDAELESVRAGKRCRLVHRQFTRIVLLELPRRAHAVVAQTDRERRSFLPHLKRAVTILNQVRNLSVDPGIFKAVDSGGYSAGMDTGGRHGGESREDRTNRPNGKW